MLKYEIIDVFLRKNIPLSLKMLSASGRLSPPDHLPGLRPWSPLGTLSPDPLFCGVQNILKLHYEKQQCKPPN